MQTKKRSLIESIAQTLIGLCVSFLIQIVLYPSLGIQVTIGQNIIITFVFLLASLIRGYFIRRYFNRNDTTKRT